MKKGRPKKDLDFRMTRGADLYLRFLADHQCDGLMLMKVDSKGRRRLAIHRSKANGSGPRGELENAIFKGDFALLREIATFMEAIQGRERTLEGNGFALTEAYLACCWLPAGAGLPPLRPFVDYSKLLEDPLARAPYDPTPAEIEKFLDNALPEPPDRKTIRRWLRKLGVKAPRS